MNQVANGLERASEDMLKNERFKAQLITNVSHDLKNPLTSIITYLDLVKQEGNYSSSIQEYLDVIDRKANQLKNLTEDVLEMSKLNSGTMKLDIMTLNYQELIHQMLADYEEKYKQNQLECVISLPLVPVMIQADPIVMQRVLDNLLSNVLKYSAPGSRVFITLVGDVLEIRNTSKEILTVEVEHLKERFVRNDSSRTTPGSGLGLSIANELLKLQNGNLEIIIDGDIFKVRIVLNQDLH